MKPVEMLGNEDVNLVSHSANNEYDVDTTDVAELDVIGLVTCLYDQRRQTNNGQCSKFFTYYVIQSSKALNKVGAGIFTVQIGKQNNPRLMSIT